MLSPLNAVYPRWAVDRAARLDETIHRRHSVSGDAERLSGSCTAETTDLYAATAASRSRRRPERSRRQPLTLSLVSALNRDGGRGQLFAGITFTIRCLTPVRVHDSVPDTRFT